MVSESIVCIMYLLYGALIAKKIKKKKTKHAVSECTVCIRFFFFKYLAGHLHHVLLSPHCARLVYNLHHFSFLEVDQASGSITENTTHIFGAIFTKVKTNLSEFKKAIFAL